MLTYLLEKLTVKVKIPPELDKDYKISGTKTEIWRMTLKLDLKN